MPNPRIVTQTPDVLLRSVKNDYSKLERQFEKLRGVFIDFGEEDVSEERFRKKMEKDALREKFLRHQTNVPFLSVIVNVAGRPRAFADALQSLACQTFVTSHPDCVEVILIQDGPEGIFDDEFRDKVPKVFPPTIKLQGFRLVGDNKPLGRATARNVGVWHASSKANVFMFLDDAMILHRDFVTEHMLRHTYATATPLALLGFKQNRRFADVDVYGRELEKLRSERPDFRVDWKWQHKLKEDEAPFNYRGQHFAPGSVIEYMKITNNLRGFRGKERVGFRALPMFFQTGLTSVTSRVVRDVGGFEEIFDVDVWGFEDSYLGLLLAAKGVMLVPCPSSLAYKIEFDDEERTERKDLQIVYHRDTFWDRAKTKEWQSYNIDKLNLQIKKLTKRKYIEKINLGVRRQRTRTRARRLSAASDTRAAIELVQVGPNANVREMLSRFPPELAEQLRHQAVDGAIELFSCPNGTSAYGGLELEKIVCEPLNREWPDDFGGLTEIVVQGLNCGLIGDASASITGWLNQTSTPGRIRVLSAPLLNPVLDRRELRLQLANSDFFTARTIRELSHLNAEGRGPRLDEMFPRRWATAVAGANFTTEYIPYHISIHAIVVSRTESGDFLLLASVNPMHTALTTGWCVTISEQMWAPDRDRPTKPWWRQAVQQRLKIVRDAESRKGDADLRATLSRGLEEELGIDFAHDTWSEPVLLTGALEEHMYFLALGCIVFVNLSLEEIYRRWAKAPDRREIGLLAAFPLDDPLKLAHLLAGDSFDADPYLLRKSVETGRVVGSWHCCSKLKLFATGMHLWPHEFPRYVERVG